MTGSTNAVLNSFLMSNMTPQYCQFNEGVWEMTENIVRLWAKERGTLYVITGSIFDRNGDRQRDADASAARMRSKNNKTRVAVPTAFYKIIARLKSPTGAGDDRAGAAQRPDRRRQRRCSWRHRPPRHHHRRRRAGRRRKVLPQLPRHNQRGDGPVGLHRQPGHSLVGARCRATAGAVT